MSYLYVKWNSCQGGLLASGLAIKPCLVSPWPLPPLRPKRSAYGVAGLRSGSGQGDKFRTGHLVPARNTSTSSSLVVYVNYFRRTPQVGSTSQHRDSLLFWDLHHHTRHRA
jgi:hypothetical protein